MQQAHTLVCPLGGPPMLTMVLVLWCKLRGQQVICMPYPSTSCWSMACCRNQPEQRVHGSALLQLRPDQAGAGAVQDRTLRSVACNALATAAFAAPGKVLPLVVQRFQVRFQHWRLWPGSEYVTRPHGDKTIHGVQCTWP